MKNSEYWKESKYTCVDGKLIASSNIDEVSVSSRLSVNLIAEKYTIYIRKYVTGRLLDLGCGKAPLYALYKDLVDDNICVDWSNSIHPDSYLDFEVDLTKKLPFKDGEFDTIIFSDVLEHLPNPGEACKEICRILSVNGVLLMNVPFYYPLHEVPHDYHRFTEYALRRYMKDAGLTVIHLDSLGGAPEIMADIFSKVVRRVPYIGYSMARFVQWATLKIVRSSFGKKVSEATREEFPFAYFVVARKSSPRTINLR